MQEDFLDFGSEAIALARENYYRTEVLRGYCESYYGSPVPSDMLEMLLKEISEKQKELIKYIDTKSTKIGHELFFAKSF